MSDFLKSFIRHAGGTWECIAPVELPSPRGRIQVTPGTTFTRGTIFMGTDVAQWLEEQYEQARSGGKGRGIRG